MERSYKSKILIYQDKTDNKKCVFLTTCLSKNKVIRVLKKCSEYSKQCDVREYIIGIRNFKPCASSVICILLYNEVKTQADNLKKWF